MFNLDISRSLYLPLKPSEGHPLCCALTWNYVMSERGSGSSLLSLLLHHIVKTLILAAISVYGHKSVVPHKAEHVNWGQCPLLQQD